MWIIGAIISLILLIITLIANAIVTPKDVGGTNITGGSSLTRTQAGVAKDYKSLKPPRKTPTFNQFCFPKGGFKVQPQQKFAAEYMAPATGNDVLLVFHRIGAGKTCLSIKVGLAWITRGRPLFVMPASLIPGFRSELRGECGIGRNKHMFVSEEDAVIISKGTSTDGYAAAIKRSDALIDKVFQIYSYNKFLTAGKVSAPIIIVDEVQNINNPQGKFYRRIRDWIDENVNSSVVLMSATPLFDDTSEIDSLARLMRIETSDPITPGDIRKLFDGKISYFAGAPDYTYPEVKLKVVKCKMSRHQASWYQATVEAEMKASGDLQLREISDSFYIKSRQRSNIVYPRGLTGQAGLDSLTPAMIRDSLDTYSAKYATMIRKLLRGGLSFIYTGFTGAGGIAAVVKCLRARGYYDYFDEDAPARARKYVIWSGDQTLREKDEIRSVFNSTENDNGSRIQIVIGSPSIKEGVSLLRVRSVHLVEPYWNRARIEQIFGRAVRYCSHKRLPAEERDVKIYIYSAFAETTLSTGMAKTNPMVSIDNYMLDCAKRKTAAMVPYIEAMIDIAVDRALW